MKNRMIQLAWLAYVTFLLAACGSLEKKSILVSNGDSKQQVIEVMGTPDERQLQGDKEAWQYCTSGAGFGWNDHRIIWFQQGRVTGITPYKSYSTGCTGAIQPVRWESAPNAVVEIRNR